MNYIYTAEYEYFDERDLGIITLDPIKALICAFENKYEFNIYEDGGDSPVYWLDCNTNVYFEAAIKALNKVESFSNKETVIKFLKLKQRENEIRIELENKEKEETIRLEELTELARLTAKYEIK